MFKLPENKTLETTTKRAVIGKALLVLAWARDGKIDVNWKAGLAWLCHGDAFLESPAPGWVQQSKKTQRMMQDEEGTVGLQQGDSVPCLDNHFHRFQGINLHASPCEEDRFTGEESKSEGFEAHICKRAGSFWVPPNLSPLRSRLELNVLSTSENQAPGASAWEPENEGTQTLILGPGFSGVQSTHNSSASQGWRY